MLRSHLARAGVALGLLLAAACNGQAASPDKAAHPVEATAKSEKGADKSGDASETVAVVSGETITLAQVDEAAAAGLIEAQQAMYQARAQALDQMVNERLLKAESAKRGIAEEELLRQELEAKVTQPTDADIEAFYNQNQAMMRGAPLDELRERIRGHLMQEQMGKRAEAFITELRNAAGVKVTLQPPRVTVDAEDSPRWGKKGAPIEIIEFSDFQCPYCSKAAATIEEVKKAYGDKVTIVYRHFPLPMHDRAAPAAEAAECANDQGKFWEYHDKLFAGSPMGDADLAAIATGLELDMPKFQECLSTHKHAETVQDDMKDGEKVGMSGTPGFYINGLILGGAQPFEAFKQVIDAELERIGKGS